MLTMEQVLGRLVTLTMVPTPVTNADVDDIVDEYLVGPGPQTAAKKADLANAYRGLTPETRRRENILGRILWHRY